MMEKTATKIIFHNVIKQLVLIVQPLIQFVLLILHIVYRLIIKHAIKIKEAFAIIQEILRLGAIF